MSGNGPAIQADGCGAPIARVRGLEVHFGSLPILRAVDLDLESGQLTALVGESGAGKSVAVAALLGLLPRTARIGGTLLLRGTAQHRALPQIALADRLELGREVRGRRVALVPQSPATWLTPVRTLGSQLHETARALVPNDPAAPGRAARRAGFPEDLHARYPHEVSGGQLQRAALALALVGGADVLLADEPTSGLDPELADLALDQLRGEADSGRAVLVVTHDLAAAERIADHVIVLYAGRIIERGRAQELFTRPRHPYSVGLLDALPTRAFAPLAGDPPAFGDLPDGCAFRPRCPRATERCLDRPALVGRADAVACHHPVEAAP